MQNKGFGYFCEFKIAVLSVFLLKIWCFVLILVILRHFLADMVSLK